MEIKAEQLEKDIEAIPGICKDGQKAIKRLFENNFGVKFAKEIDAKRGQIYKTQSDYYMLYEDLDRNLQLVRIDDDFGGTPAFVRMKSPDGVKGLREYKSRLVADSPEEYFKLKFDGKL